MRDNQTTIGGLGYVGLPLAYLMAHMGLLSGIFVFDIFGSYPPELVLSRTEKKKIIFNKNASCTNAEDITVQRRIQFV